jgi:transcriptional regulator with XRE-family HTH domain
MGQRLKQARQHSGMTIRELGALAGIASSVVVDTENGKRIPRADTVERMAWALKLSACWLAYGEGKAPAWYSESDAPIQR